jgi:hypothetical protein
MLTNPHSDTLDSYRCLDVTEPLRVELQQILKVAAFVKGATARYQFCVREILQPSS